jgi:Na+-driven multidrug efflux pump
VRLALNHTTAPCKWRLGLDGAAYAKVLSQVTSTLLLLAYSCGRGWKLGGSEDATWAGLSMQACCGWGTYLTYALPSMAMICVEWWACEVEIVMAGGWQAEGGCRRGLGGGGTCMAADYGWVFGIW